MALPTKHLRCSKCQNVYNNHKKKIVSGAYFGLHEINCSRCSSKWLVCPSHDLRWSRLRYCYAQEHVSLFHTMSNIDDLDCNINKRKFDDVISDEDIFNQEICDESDVDEPTNCSPSDNDFTDIALNTFTACHREVTLHSYRAIR